MCELILSGFADEAAIDKTADQQMSAFSALGLSYLSLRFIDVGSGIQNVMDLTDGELDTVCEKLEAYDLKVSSIGSPIGKTKLLNIEDGTNNTYFEFTDYLENQVTRACTIAKKMDCRLIRGFSFYHPKGTAAQDHVDLAADRLQQIAQLCDEHELTFGLEVEANLIGHNADLLVALHESVAEDSMVLIFDGANLVTQGYSTIEIVEQFKRMQHALGWIHVKDHRSRAATAKDKYVDEDALQDFVPPGEGAGGYSEILGALKSQFPDLQKRLAARGIPGLFADMEPHLKGGGQFGGFSGPDGFGIATRAFCSLCERNQIGIKLRDFPSIS